MINHVIFKKKSCTPNETKYICPFITIYLKLFQTQLSHRKDSTAVLDSNDATPSDDRTLDRLGYPFAVVLRLRVLQVRPVQRCTRRCMRDYLCKTLVSNSSVLGERALNMIVLYCRITISKIYIHTIFFNKRI